MPNDICRGPAESYGDLRQLLSHSVGMEPALATVWHSHLRSLVKGYRGRGLPERFSWGCFHVIWRSRRKHLVVIKRKEGKAKRKREKH